MRTAFDTDVLTAIGYGVPSVLDRLKEVPVADQFLPIVVLEELLRGRLNAIKLAESGKGKLTLEVAYARFGQSMRDVYRFQVLQFTSAASKLVDGWKKQKVRVGTKDLRIAAIARTNGMKLVSLNHHDFRRIPELDVEFWG